MTGGPAPRRRARFGPAPVPFSIDHVVIASGDLYSAIANARAAGFTVVPGGVHGSGHTHNALIAFADGSYLELFAPTAQRRTAEHRWFPRIRNGGGLVDFCLLGPDLATSTAEIRARGVEFSAPFAMSRLTPEGTRIEWLLSTPPGVTGQNGWPFLIEDVTPRASRVPHAPEQLRHANDAKGVAGITVLVRDLSVATEAWEAILGTGARGAPGRDDAGVLFSIAGAWLHLREPTSAEERLHLERHGQGPYRVTLTRGGEPGPNGGSSLEQALFSGAKIDIA